MLEMFLASLEESLGLLVCPPLAPIARMGIIQAEVDRLMRNSAAQRNPPLVLENRSDQMYQDAISIANEIGFVTVSSLQRQMRIGFTRAARLIDMMIENGFCEKEPEISGKRKILHTTKLKG